MSDKETKDLNTIVEIETLLNAQLHDGNPQHKPIMGKILGVHTEFRSRVPEVNAKIQEMVEQVKSMDPEAIAQRLDELAPDAVDKHLERKEKQAEQRRQDKEDMTNLPNVVEGEFKVRYAPDPSKYPHLGQGVNYLINRIFADKYDGAVVLRFDDTNPNIVKPEYYEAIKDGLRWIGAHWDEEIRASSFIDEFYAKTEELIAKEEFYVCFCSGEMKRELSESGTACKHRLHTAEDNLTYFRDMVAGNYEIGGAIVRLRGDMSSDNTVMRDPIMLRIVDQQHPMLDKMYYVFPTYDFESSYFEATLGITHVVRSGEFGTMRQELQSYLIKKLGGTVPEFVSFGRINIQGCPTKGRVIRELVNTGVVEGWDDIRLITLQGLKKRGIHPETARLIAQEAGFSPQNTQIAWTTIESMSRQLLEPEAKRFFFVENPVELVVEGETPEAVEYPYHPDHLDWGMRTLDLSSSFYIATKDARKYEKGDIFRLKDLFNVKILERGELRVVCEYAGNEIISDMDKIQWVPDQYLEGTLDVPLTLEDEKGNIRDRSMHKISGYFETNVGNLEDGEVVQLERVGFAKLRQNQDGTMGGHMVHVY